MDAVVKPLTRSAVPTADNTQVKRPSREEAEAAVRTLIRWAGDDPAREGLIDTPKRVVKAYRGALRRLPRGRLRNARARLRGSRRL